jgi:hypothetical protein
MITTMALSRDFKETILARVQRDPKVRNALLKEGIETLLAGNVDTGKSILRDYTKPQSTSSNSAPRPGHRRRA